MNKISSYGSMLLTFALTQAAEYGFPNDDMLAGQSMTHGLGYKVAKAVAQAGKAVASTLVATEKLAEFVDVEKKFIAMLDRKIVRIDSAFKSLKGMEIYLGEFVKNPLFYFKSNPAPAKLEKFDEFLDARLEELELAFDQVPWASGLSAVNLVEALEKIATFRAATGIAIGYYVVRPFGERGQADEQFGGAISVAAQELREVVRQRMPLLDKQAAIYAQQIKDAARKIQEHYKPESGLAELLFPVQRRTGVVSRSTIRR